MGVLIGVAVGPEAQAGGSGTSDSVSVAHTAPATPGGSTGSPSPTPAASPVPRVVPKFDPNLPVTVALGDSITFKPNSWFRQVCADAVLHNCLNSGISGNTTKQMLARLNVDALNYQPRILILMGGTNDLKHHQSTKQIMRRIRTILNRARATRASVVLCTIPPRNHYGGRVRSLNTAIRKYANRSDVPLLDFYPLLGTKNGSYKRGLSLDGVHPNRRAANRMTALAERQLPALLSPLP
ncbi:MAG TPA: GDSL-type esterase/lipase family protein [Kineosporiaceae bacterium]|nr:GDSL-type esterase/lipase family protein [Kineosporiaceae bacterium]